MRLGLVVTCFVVCLPGSKVCSQHQPCPLVFGHRGRCCRVSICTTTECSPQISAAGADCPALGSAVLLALRRCQDGSGCLQGTADGLACMRLTPRSRASAGVEPGYALSMCTASEQTNPFHRHAQRQRSLRNFYKGITLFDTASLLRRSEWGCAQTRCCEINLQTIAAMCTDDMH